LTGAAIPVFPNFNVIAGGPGQVYRRATAIAREMGTTKRNVYLRFS
jgi:hypothetical protein